MKKKYISPAIKTEELITQDVLYTSHPDNDTLQNNRMYGEQYTLLSEFGDFLFNFNNNN